VWAWRRAAGGGAAWAAALLSKSNGASGAPPAIRGVAWDMFSRGDDRVDNHDHDLDDGDAFFLTFGVTHVKLWTPPFDTSNNIVGSGEGGGSVSGRYAGKNLLFKNQTRDTAVSALFLPLDPASVRRRNKEKGKGKSEGSRDPSPMANRRAVTGMASGFVYVWDLGVRECLAAVSAHGPGAGTGVRGLSLVPLPPPTGLIPSATATDATQTRVHQGGSALLLTGGADGRVGVWRVDSPLLCDRGMKAVPTLLGMRDLPPQRTPLNVNVDAWNMSSMGGDRGGGGGGGNGDGGGGGGGAVEHSRDASTGRGGGDVRAVWALACCRTASSSSSSSSSSSLLSSLLAADATEEDVGATAPSGGELIVTVGLDDASLVVIRGLEGVNDSRPLPSARGAEDAPPEEGGAEGSPPEEGGAEDAPPEEGAAERRRWAAHGAAGAAGGVTFDEVSSGHVADVSAVAWSPPMALVSTLHAAPSQDLDHSPAHDPAQAQVGLGRGQVNPKQNLKPENSRP